jgi:hypothetical protein
MKIKVRRAKVSDIPQLVDKMFSFYSILKERGAKDINRDDSVLRGGITIEVGNGFNSPNWFCVLADNETEIMGFLVGVLEFCSPVSEDMKCVRVHAIYLDNDSFIGPKILTAMWKELDDWAVLCGAGHYYANVHPGNQPSIRATKACGFKHHYTQFYRPVGKQSEREIEGD